MNATLTIATSRKRQVVDINELAEKSLPAGASGAVHLFVQHTTTAISVADLDPGTDLDMLDVFEALIPKLTYRHPHDPIHALVS